MLGAFLDCSVSISSRERRFVFWFRSISLAFLEFLSAAAKHIQFFDVVINDFTILYSHIAMVMNHY